MSADNSNRKEKQR